jgi:endo-1,4-beta-xylanase
MAQIILLAFCLLSSVPVWTQDPIGLRASSNLRGISLGTAVNINRLRKNVDNTEHNQKIRNNYLMLVPESELKPQSVWKGENIYNWEPIDFLLGSTQDTKGWIQKNSMQLKGHNLVWALDMFIPNWLLKEESNITSDKAKQLLSDYIHAVVGRYRGKMPWWDVVNEAIENYNNTNPFNLRNCFWFRKLGPDFIKYAFMFAYEADPNVQLYYNDYKIESVGLKATDTINLVNWLRSEGVIVHGIGLQWHINISTVITPGDGYYQSAQQFVDNKLDFMITELDVPVPTNGGNPINIQDLQTQGSIYRSLLNLALHFSPNCKAILTWGFTDRYSWITDFSNYKQGAALPLDWLYLPKPAYWQIQEVLARVIVDGIYRLSPQSQPDKCLGTSPNTTSSDVQLYSGDCNNPNQKWNITWLGDGTYRFSSQNDNNRVLGAYNTTAKIDNVQTYNWTGDVNQEWAFSPQENNTFRVVPRTAWGRVMTVYNASKIVITNHNETDLQNWILTKI